MLNRSLAVANGIVLALMIFANGLLVENLGNTPATLLIHIIGLITIGSIILITKEKWISLKGISPIFLLGGVTGIANVYLLNISFLASGATTTLLLSAIGQIAASTGVDHFGLFGMDRYPFNPKKILGLAVIMVGLILVVLS